MVQCSGNSISVLLRGAIFRKDDLIRLESNSSEHRAFWVRQKKVIIKKKILIENKQHINNGSLLENSRLLMRE